MTSEPEKLLPVIQADRDAAFRYWCHTGSIAADNNRAVEWRSKLNHGSMDGREVVQAFARHRLSSPVSGTDVSLREALEERANVACDAECDGDRGLHEAGCKRATALLSASPSTLIPVIAKAGEREATHDLIMALVKHMRDDLGFVVHHMSHEDQATFYSLQDRARQWLIDVADAALSTPATLDNTAVEGQERARDWLVRFQRDLATFDGDQSGQALMWLANQAEQGAAHVATLTAKTEKAE